MGISVWQILIVLLIVVLLFGTKKLRTLGGDLGEAVKGFKKGIAADENDNVASLEQAADISEQPINAKFAETNSSSK